MFNRKFPVIVTLALLSLGGCTRRQTWQFSLAPDQGVATVDMDGARLVFEGVPFDHSGGGGSLVVAGMGTHRNTVTAGGKSFENYYADGVNTITFQGHTLELRESGTKLHIGTQEFDLTEGKKTIVIGKDGTGRIVE